MQANKTHCIHTHTSCCVQGREEWTGQKDRMLSKVIKLHLLVGSSQMKKRTNLGVGWGVQSYYCIAGHQKFG